ncbi:MAG: hypothetical protein IJI45_13360 [Anaerolineaceae bacterium]|nr:hypothetical protein [Anaerolineaceae bacterium]
MKALDRKRKKKILIVGQCLEKYQIQVSIDMNMKIKERIDRLLDIKDE